MSKKDKLHNEKAGAGNTAPSSTTDTTGGVNPEVVEDLDPIQVLAAEVEEWKDYARRAQAEFENTRKRLEARAAEETKRASERVVEGLLVVLDDLEYALKHARETDNEMTDGVTAIHTKLLSALAREGVEVIDPLNQPFDHDTAQAVQVVENSEVPEQTVVVVLQKGYRMSGKVLRPAMVVVSTGGPSAS